MDEHTTPPAGDDETLDDTSSNDKRNPALGAARERRREERHRAIALLPEVRYFDPSRVDIETRSLDDTDEYVMTGSPIMFGSEYRVVDPWGEFVERIHPGAVTDLIAHGVDTRLLLNHGGLPMARTKSGTMDLWDTPESLKFKATLDGRMQLSNDFYHSVKRGDLDQMSVGMLVGDDDWGMENGVETRDIYILRDLPDVSGVTYPCSDTTSIEVAHRMAMAVPVESRARLRRLYVDLRSGRTVKPDRVEALRAFLDVDVDPGEDTRTPTGTGRLGSPDGDGDTYADAGTDGSVGGGGPGDNADASGTRSDESEVEPRDDAAETADDKTSTTSRAKALQLRAKALKASLDA